MTAHILKFLTPGIFLLALTGCDNSTSAESQQLTQALVRGIPSLILVPAA
ncbi:hypothetical protein [Citrobacter portucalensis]|nr:hypothetical protein [Citrobacter portucalensis]